MWATVRVECGVTIDEFGRLTLAELDHLVAAIDARTQTADWQSARIVAMLVAVNSKRGRYEPIRYMANGAEIAAARARAAAERAEREPLTGGEVLAAFRAAGMKINDKRKNKGMTQ